MTQYREVEFIPTDWVGRAAWWPGLQVHSRPIRVPVDVPCSQRRKTDSGIPTQTAGKIEQLLREALLPGKPFQSIDLMEDLLSSLDTPENIPEHRNTVAQLAER